MLDLSVILAPAKNGRSVEPVVTRICDSARRADLSAEIILIGIPGPNGRCLLAAAPSDEREASGSDGSCLVRTCDAVSEAMRTAMGTVVVVIDTDESHVVDRVPELVRAAADPAIELVIGSRVAESLERQSLSGWLSRMTASAANTMAGLNGRVRDPFSGVYAVRSESLSKVPSALQQEMRTALDCIVECQFQRIVEIPTHVNGTADDRPRMPRRHPFTELRSLKRVLEQRFGHAAYFVQFGLVGASGMVVDLSVLALLLKWAPFAMARGMAIWIAMTWNFTLNRNVTFSYARGRSVIPQYLGYCASCLLGAGVNWASSVALATYDPFFRTHPVLAAFAGVAAGMLFNYLLCHRLVFRKHG